jgi:hypothetical protein
MFSAKSISLLEREPEYAGCWLLSRVGKFAARRFSVTSWFSVDCLRLPQLECLREGANPVTLIV